MADGQHYLLDTWGSTETRTRSPERDGRLVSSTRETHVTGGRRSSRARRRPAADRFLGNSVGAIGWRIGSG